MLWRWSGKDRGRVGGVTVRCRVLATWLSGASEPGRGLCEVGAPIAGTERACLAPARGASCLGRACLRLRSREAVVCFGTPTPPKARGEDTNHSHQPLPQALSSATPSD